MEHFYLCYLFQFPKNLIIELEALLRYRKNRDFEISFNPVALRTANTP